MPPTSKKLEGHIASGTFVRAFVCASVCPLLHSVHARVLKFHIWILHGKIADTYFFPSGLCPFPELRPFQKICMKSYQQNISKAVEARALKPGE